MSVFKILGVIALLAAAAVGWRTFGKLLAPAASSTAAVPIVFDNGTVRQPPVPSSAPGLRAVPAQGVGALRKCVANAGNVVYTNFDCPAGHRQEQLKSDRVTVLEGGAPARAAEGPGQTGAQPTRKSLHDALDLSQGETLRDQATRRAVDAATR